MEEDGQSIFIQRRAAQFEYLRRLRKKGITDALVPRAAERTLERFPGRHY